MPKHTRADSAAIDSAIAGGMVPRTQLRSRGLILSIPGEKQCVGMIDDQGGLTRDGAYYYETTGNAAPNKGLDYSQQPSGGSSAHQTPRRFPGNSLKLGWCKQVMAIYQNRVAILPRFKRFIRCYHSSAQQLGPD